MRNWASRLAVPLAGVLLLAAAGGSYVSAEEMDRQMFLEQEHFLGCLAYVYDPALWISYNGSLYFVPKTDEQSAKLQEMVTARAGYRVLVNRQTRHQIAAKALAQTAIEPAWQAKILLPYSTTNENLTPTLNRQLRIVPSYRFLRAFGQDAFIEAGDTIYYVLDFSREGAHPSGTNLFLIKEGWKSFTTASGELRRVEAFTDVSLDKTETAVLKDAVAGFRKAAKSLADAFTSAQARAEDFEGLKSRANDSSPYFEYLLAKAYLDGAGTDKDEALGMDWMRRAATNGSGDAVTYLQNHGPSER